MSQSDIQNTVVTKTVPLPENIDGQDYTVNGTLAGSVLTLTFSFPGIPLSDNAVVNLGPRVEWVSSSFFLSTNEKSVIKVEKYYNPAVGDVMVKLGFG
jgi:hypothetical protein